MAQHTHVQLLWLIAILAVVSVAFTGRLTSRDASQGIHASVTQILPAASALARSDQNSAAFSELFVETFKMASADRAPNFETMTTFNVARDKAWLDYKLLAVGFPGEKPLQAQVEAARDVMYEAAPALIASLVGSPEDIAIFVSGSADEARSLAKLQALYQAPINKALESADGELSGSQSAALMVAGVAVTILMVAFSLRFRAVWRRERIQGRENRRNDLESGLQRALEMARTEEGCFELVRQAVQRSSPLLSSELLVADSSQAHFHQVMNTGPDGGPGCAVVAPDACPATSRGQTQRWSTSEAIDSCPNLQNRTTGPCSAVCVPVSIAGKTIGVVHATGPDQHPPGMSTTADLEVIVRKAGDRIGILRAFSRTEAQARTDPLTGLLNRRSLETSVADVEAVSQSFVVAYGDLDNFKLLNDIHGHDAGDRALRLFARVLRDSIRPNDIAARYGGEEFVVVLPGCTLADAYLVIDRVRTHLADAQRGGVVPAFTVSFGLAPSVADHTFAEIVELADAALLRAKAEGRDRVVVAPGFAMTPELESVSTTAPIAAVATS